MERSRFSTIGSIFTAALFAGAILLSGCSDSLTGATPSDGDEVTVQQRAQHNQPSNANGGDGDGTSTTPGAGHNTSDQD